MPKCRLLNSSLTLLILALLVLSLRYPAQAAGEPLYGFADGTGQVMPYGRNAKRVIGLAPNVTEMIFFLGLGPRDVGRSDFCDYPPEAAKLPSVGGFTDTSVEQIVALRPDLVVAYQGNSLALVAQLRQAGLKVLAFKEAASLDEIGTQMTELWKVASAPGAPEPPALAQWRNRLAKETIKSYPQAKFFSMFFGYPEETAYTCAPGSFIDDLMRRAGARNVVTDGSQRWPQVSAEFIVSSQPEWILTATNCTADEKPAAKRAELLQQLRADKVWSTLPATREGQVAVLDSDILLRPGPRIVDALAELNSVLTKAVLSRMLHEAAP